MITVVEKKKSKKATESQVLGLSKDQLDALYPEIPNGMWFISFAQKSGTYGIDLRATQDEAQSLVSKVC